MFNKDLGYRRDHAEELVRNGVAEECDSLGTFKNIAFNVIEEKASGLRQRFILWTREANVILKEKEKYVADVPLKHVSCYLPLVKNECSSGRDFRTGFYQIEIPRESRKHFTFVCEDGSVFRLCRLPMGHSCAPELMHTVAATLAGIPGYAKEEFCNVNVEAFAWIDNILFSGKREAVEAATASLDKLSEECGASWKDADSYSAASKHTFIGVYFDHKNKTVSPSKRLLEKISCFDATKATISDTESQLGRLLHAGSIAKVPAGNYWFAMKFIRRLTNFVNRGVKKVSDFASIPPSVILQLSNWAKAISKERIYTEEKPPGDVDVFVDASKKGWGSVIYEENGKIEVMGEMWSDTEKPLHINILEARAWEMTVKRIPKRFLKEGIHLKFHIDNTTVIGVGEKGHCSKSLTLNDCVMRALNFLKESGVSFSLSYVKSSENVADIPSRLKMGTADERREAELAVGRFLNLRGGGVSRSP
eukprot:TRINITY_DN2318_c0_g1_i14.p1 TRINITY_DN2318_c0_g1~~TRINITY_DN2318_c0_g1_i14.p1  ORF type:complete len:477 (+),score=49.94 TRINITY_DN2318_c0_g1_i14:979-2409(+)